MCTVVTSVIFDTSNALAVAPVQHVTPQTGTVSIPLRPRLITISRATYESMRENEQLLRACLVAAVPS